MDFTARFVVTTVESEQEARLRFVQFWTDPSAMQAASKAAIATLAAQK